ncbi:two-component regulator propeller domain-containing protein [Olivibacter sp. CPCC 100613]|uniref:hybrid sensor histidine kinase/response regulator n=1 Tax=Olivibacter sp. CPCC 100613 TaxID=3079931 RepID=UPI002FF71FC4
MRFLRMLLTVRTIIICSIFIGKYSYGQNYWFRHYDIRDGLSYNYVNCSVQDQKGFLWFGTWDGLNRFDGHEFKIFRTDNEQENAIGNNFISSLYVDGNGTLWVGTHNGLWRYNPDNESFTRLDFTFTKWIASITDDFHGNLWFICNDQVVKYNLASEKYTVFNEHKTTALCATPNGDLWLGTALGRVICYRYEINAREEYQIGTTDMDKNPIRVNALFYTDQKKLLVGTENSGLKLLDPDRAEFTHVFTRSTGGSPVTVTDIIQSKNGEYWVGTTVGIYLYDAKLNENVRLVKNDRDPNSLADNYIKDLAIDREGGIWVACKYAGLNYFNRKNAFFSVYRPEGAQPVVGPMVADAYNNIWAATERAGLFFLNTKKNTFNARLSTYKDVSGLYIADDKLWLGVEKRGFAVFDIKANQISNYYNAVGALAGLANENIHFFLKTSAGLLIGTTNGIFVFDQKGKKITPIRDIPPLVVSSIFEDHLGGIWLGTYFSGLYYIDTHLNRGTVLPIDFSSGGRHNNTVTSIMEDINHTMWFSTEGSGLVKYDPKTKQLVYLTTSEGLPSNNTFKILRSGRNLWVSTAAGLCKLDTKMDAIKTFNRSNGLPVDQFIANSGCAVNDSMLYFGSTEGIVGFNAYRLSEEVGNPPLFITGIQVDNTELKIGSDNPLSQSVIETEMVRLPYDKSSVSIDFAALSYQSPDLTRYAYMLDGLEKSWTKLKTNRRVYFTKLPPGNYLFKVKASSGYGVWGKIRTIHIIITPPWWSSKAAYAVYFLLIALGIVLFFRFYQKRIQEKSKRLFNDFKQRKDRELYEAKIDFFTNIAHEIRTPLTLIMAPLEKIGAADDIREVKDNLPIIKRNTNRLVKLTNQLLDFRKIEQRELKLNFVKTNISHLLLENYTAFKVTAEMQGMKCSLLMEDATIYGYVDPEALEKIINNLLKNALKYGEKIITVRLDSDPENNVRIIVTNDGPIIPNNLKERIFEPFYRLEKKEATEGTGIGLALSRSLAELHNGTLKVGEMVDCNEFILILPLHQEIEFDLQDVQELAVNTAETDHPEERVGKRILLVEDNLEIMRFLSRELCVDYQVFMAENGLLALQILKDIDVDLIISDVMMPEMDGFSFCKKVKNDVNMSHIPVILLTAKNSIDAKIEGLEQGADVYIEKPFSPRYLHAQIVSLLANRIKLMEYFVRSPKAGIASIAPSTIDNEFFKRLEEIILNNMDNADLDVDELAATVNMSRRNLYRKIKAVANMSPAEMITLIRLKRAAELLLTNDIKIYEVAYQTGFKSPDTFTRNFFKQFGVLPTDYLKGMN